MRTRISTSVAALAATATLGACSLTTADTGTPTTSDVAPSSGSSVSSATTDSSATTTADTSVLASVLAANQASHADDNDTVVDEAGVVNIALSSTSATSDGDGVTIDGSTITIGQPGAYRLTGTLSDGQIVVDSAAEGKVQLVLNGVDLTSSTGSPLVIRAADKAIIVLADGTDNTVTDAASYADISDDAPSAAIDSTTDLTIAGGGGLTVHGLYNDAINSSDGFVIASGTLTMDAVDDGIRGKDYIIITGGTLDITAGGDALKSDNNTDTNRGYVAIHDGTLTISAGDDAIKGYSDVAIDGGTITITDSVEGIEASSIAIAGGTIELISSDDGINVSGDNPQFVNIAGGTITIDAEGDGFDSNGAAAMTGGTLTVYGPTNNGNGAIDADGGFDVSGGTLWAVGAAGMAQTPSEGSTQAFVSATLQSATSGDITILDADGNELGALTSDKQFGSIVYSSPAVAADGTYGLVVNGTTTATVSANQYATGMGGGPGDRSGRGWQPGQPPTGGPGDDDA